MAGRRLPSAIHVTPSEAHCQAVRGINATISMNHILECIVTKKLDHNSTN